MSIKINELQDGQQDDFFELFFDYLKKSKKNKSGQSVDAEAYKLQIIKQHKKKAISISLLELDNNVIGFGIYQIDGFLPDWNKKPGFGFIKEFYILKDYRKQKYGKMLFTYIEKSLLDKNAKGIYLNCEKSNSAVKFWEACGFKPQDENKSDLITYIK